mmetsp:Transcript_51903/g.149656  ORF Transcript_51903/g.149656 Transcript_51903/m.149656 type:complete len:200 (+) Transcript_51903:720-1319(+)
MRLRRAVAGHHALAWLAGGHRLRSSGGRLLHFQFGDPLRAPDGPWLGVRRGIAVWDAFDDAGAAAWRLRHGRRGRRGRRRQVLDDRNTGKLFLAFGAALVAFPHGGVDIGSGARGQLQCLEQRPLPVASQPAQAVCNLLEVVIQSRSGRMHLVSPEAGARDVPPNGSVHRSALALQGPLRLPQGVDLPLGLVLVRLCGC